MGLQFEWDPNKARVNQRKHQVTFEEAATVFADVLSVTVPDPDHSEYEQRYITVGLSQRHRLLMVAHTERNDRIRIISARELTPRPISPSAVQATRSPPPKTGYGTGACGRVDAHSAVHVPVGASSDARALASWLGAAS